MSDPKNKLDDTASKTGQAAKSAAAAISHTASDAADQVSSTTSNVWEKTKDVGHRVVEAVSDDYDPVSSGTRNVMRKGRDTAVELEHGFERYIKKQPVLMVAAGVGLGILIGFAVGSKRTSH